MTNYNDPNELLAVVNDRDEECGSAPRQVVHKLALLHRAVHVLVFLPQGQLVIQRRSHKKDTYPLHWECVGGHLGPGEAYETAALREVEEELGVTPKKSDFLGKLGASPETGHEFISIYRAEVVLPVYPNEDEIAEWRIVTLEDLRNMILTGTEKFSPVFLKTLEAVGILSPK